MLWEKQKAVQKDLQEIEDGRSESQMKWVQEEMD
jgi:hypothetical protein